MPPINVGGVTQRGWRVWYGDGKALVSWKGRPWNAIPTFDVQLVEWWYKGANGKWYVERDLGLDEYESREGGETKFTREMDDDAWWQLHNQVLRLWEPPPDGDNLLAR
jgi:hypothetical protein